jgi:YVTN family beta-propeller protein
MSHNKRIHNTTGLTLAAAMVGTLWAGAVAAHEDYSNYLFVPNRASAQVTVLDRTTNQIVARIDVGKVPHQVLVSEVAGKLVTSNTADDTISIVDLKSFRTEATVSLGAEPEHMALGPDGLTLAVGNIAAGTVSLVSLGDNREIARVTGLIQPHNLTFGPDGTRLYVANLGAEHVSVVDVATAKVIDEIPVAEPTALASRGGLSGREYQGVINVTPSPDGRLGFAAHGEGNVLAVIDLESGVKLKSIAVGELPWRAYGTAKGRYMLVPNNGDRTVSVVDTARLEVVATLPGAADMTGVNGDLDETTAFVISRGESKVVILDLETMAPAGEIALPGTPETAVASPDGKSLYVALSSTNQVAVIDLPSRKLSAVIDHVGDEPWGATLVGGDNYCH